jgi:sulfur relay (sulfurtransferase) DsrF/TusC family protein
MPVRLLVESQGTVSTFLRAARHLAAAAPTDVFLIDDGVGFAVDASGDVAGIVAAGGQVRADSRSLAERGIDADALTAGVVAADLDAVADLLFDPAVRVVWH